MFWSSLSSTSMKKYGQVDPLSMLPAGIIWDLNNCFINAGFCLLLQVEAFMNFVEEFHETSPTAQLIADLYRLLKIKKRSPSNQTNIKKIVDELFPPVGGVRQMNDIIEVVDVLEMSFLHESNGNPLQDPVAQFGKLIKLPLQSGIRWTEMHLGKDEKTLQDAVNTFETANPIADTPEMLFIRRYIVDHCQTETVINDILQVNGTRYLLRGVAMHNAAHWTCMSIHRTHQHAMTYNGHQATDAIKYKQLPHLLSHGALPQLGRASFLLYERLPELPDPDDAAKYASVDNRKQVDKDTFGNTSLPAIMFRVEAPIPVYEPIPLIEVKVPPPQENPKHKKKESTEPPRIKRPCIRTTQLQRTMLARSWHAHYDGWSINDYVNHTGIRRCYIIVLLRKLRRGDSIVLKQRTGGRKKAVTDIYRELIIDTLHSNPEISIRGLEQMCQIRYENPTVRTSDILETAESEPPGRSAIYRYITSDDIIADCGGNRFVWKVSTPRDPESNSDENKEDRVKAIERLHHFIQKGYEWLSIDETHFDLGFTKRRVWGHRGSKTFSISRGKKLCFSVITCISSTNGVVYALAVLGTVDEFIFNGFISKVLERIRRRGSAVFWLDNASVHNRLTKLLAETGHAVVFNTRYTPEANPIEMLFAQWKKTVNATIETWNTDEELVRQVGEVLLAMRTTDERHLFEHVRNTVFTRILNREDL